MIQYEIIKRPLVTEKTNIQKEISNQVTFEVDRRANRIEIRRAVEKIFNVRVAEVRTMKVKGKTIKTGQVLDFGKGRKGRKIAIVLDTLPGKEYVQAVRNADLLVHESVFLESEAKRARETFHSTALQAAKVARQAKVKKLLLTHFSNRYKELKEIEGEARKAFKESKAARELMVEKVERNPMGTVK